MSQPKKKEFDREDSQTVEAFYTKKTYSGTTIWEAGVKFNMSSYKAGNNYSMTIYSNPLRYSTATINEVSGSMLELSFAVWDIHLLMKLGMFMDDLGFTSYDNGINKSKSAKDINVSKYNEFINLNNQFMKLKEGGCHD